MKKPEQPQASFAFSGLDAAAIERMLLPLAKTLEKSGISGVRSRLIIEPIGKKPMGGFEIALSIKAFDAEVRPRAKRASRPTAGSKKKK